MVAQIVAQHYRPIDTLVRGAEVTHLLFPSKQSNTR